MIIIDTNKTRQRFKLSSVAIEIVFLAECWNRLRYTNIFCQTQKYLFL